MNASSANEKGKITAFDDVGASSSAFATGTLIKYFPFDFERNVSLFRVSIKSVSAILSSSFLFCETVFRPKSNTFSSKVSTSFEYPFSTSGDDSTRKKN